MNMSKIDMTQGSILGRAAQFALPICIGNILQQLYGTVDTLVIGNFCDASALAAVATSSQPLEILLCIFLGIGSGISILISQAAGASDADRLRKLAQTAVFFLYAASLPLTLLGVAVGPFLLRLMQVPADAMPYAIVYLRITTLGILGNMGYNFNAGILQYFLAVISWHFLRYQYCSGPYTDCRFRNGRHRCCHRNCCLTVSVLDIQHLLHPSYLSCHEFSGFCAWF